MAHPHTEEKDEWTKQILTFGDVLGRWGQRPSGRGAQKRREDRKKEKTPDSSIWMGDGGRSTEDAYVGGRNGHVDSETGALHAQALSHHIAYGAACAQRSDRAKRM